MCKDNRLKLVSGSNWCCAVSGKWAKFTAVKLFSLTGSKVKPLCPVKPRKISRRIKTRFSEGFSCDKLIHVAAGWNRNRPRFSLWVAFAFSGQRRGFQRFPCIFVPSQMPFAQIVGRQIIPKFLWRLHALSPRNFSRGCQWSTVFSRPLMKPLWLLVPCSLGFCPLVACGNSEPGAASCLWMRQWRGGGSHVVRRVQESSNIARTKVL